MIKNYYKILNVPKSASEKRIKKAYHELVKLYHPDKNSGLETEFREVVEAYEYLIKNKKIKGLKRYKVKGADLKVTIRIKREDLIRTKNRIIQIKRKNFCPTCKGTGSEKGYTKKCPLCGGSGLQGLALVLGNKKHCVLCNGAGVIPQKPLCVKCRGKGLVIKSTHYTIRLNPLSEFFVFKKLGDCSFNGETGNLKVYLDIEEDPNYYVKNLNIYGKLKISPAQAIIGDKIWIHLFGKKQEIRILPGVQNNGTVEFNKLGISYRKETGYLSMKIEIVIPKIISNKEKELYKKLLIHEKESVWPTILTC